MRRCVWFVWTVPILLFIAAVVPGSVQGQLPPVFVTNTPTPPQPVISTPAAPINRFVLRSWRESDLLEVLHTRVRQLRPGAADLQQAVKLIQYELARRFPGAPRDPAVRERLVNAMLAAPPGSIDMRAIVRPYIEAAVNRRGPDPQGNLLPFEQDGFQVSVIPANIDGTGPEDAMLHIRYTGPDDVMIYEDYVPVIAVANGIYRILTAPDLPAAPLGNLAQVETVGVGDFNGDGLDELAISLDDGQLNRELRIFGWRGGNLVNLVQPGQQIRYGLIENWMAGGSPLEIRIYREESAEWQCLGEQAVTWRWSANFFRPAPSPEGYFFQNTASCLFYGAEPLYALPIDEALATINDILPFAPSEDDYSAQRARMIQAMLQAFNGDFGSALATALDLEGRAEPGSWLAAQTGAFITALGTPGIQPLQVCAALLEASAHGACNIDDALTRILAEQPLSRSRDIQEQLLELGIVVQNQLTLSTVGRADRQAVRFNLAGEHWWAFAPLDPQFYIAEKIDPLPGFEPIRTPLPVITAPPAVYDALLVNDAPATALTLVDGLIRSSPQAAVSAEVRFLQALSFDLLADRTRARQAYYDLWQQSPLSVWGQLAAEHLEQR
jgi:hypothetical protein